MSARWIVRAGRTVLAWRRRGQDSRLLPGRAECRNGSTLNSGRSSHRKRDAFSTSPLQEKTAGEFLSGQVGGGCPHRHSAWAQIARGSHSEYLWSLCAFSEKKRPEKQLPPAFMLTLFFCRLSPGANSSRSSPPRSEPHGHNRRCRSPYTNSRPDAVRDGSRAYGRGGRSGPGAQQCI